MQRDETRIRRIKNRKPLILLIEALFKYFVGVAGFEPTTSWSQTRRDTGLRYTPIGIFIH